MPNKVRIFYVKVEKRFIASSRFCYSKSCFCINNIQKVYTCCKQLSLSTFCYHSAFLFSSSLCLVYALLIFLSRVSLLCQWSHFWWNSPLFSQQLCNPEGEFHAELCGKWKIWEIFKKTSIFPNVFANSSQ